MIGQTAPAGMDCPACKDYFLGISSSYLIVCMNTEGLLAILVSSRTFVAEIFHRHRRTLSGGLSVPWLSARFTEVYHMNCISPSLSPVLHLLTL